MHNRPAGAPEGPLCKRPYPAWSPTAPPARRPEKTKPPAGDRGLRTLGGYGVKRIRHSLLAPQQGELRGGAATPNPSALQPLDSWLPGYLTRLTCCRLKHTPSDQRNQAKEAVLRRRLFRLARLTLNVLLTFLNGRSSRNLRLAAQSQVVGVIGASVRYS